MSIVTLKKNSKRFQDKISGKQQGFSLNGGYRNQGWIGQDTLGRHIAYTPFRGIAPIGHGGTNGHYVINVVEGGSNSSNDPTIIKRSTMNTKGHLFSTVDYPTSIFNTSCSSNKCNTIWVKKFCPEQRSQGIYISEKSQKNVCVVIKPNVCFDKTYCKEENNIDIIKSDRRSYCKYGYYRIGGKKIYRRPYSKNFNPLPMSSSQYTKTALMTKNNLPTPACKASYPPSLNHIGNCDRNFSSPQEAIDAGVLPEDWMNCKPCSRSARPYTTTFNSYDLQCNISIKNFNCEQLADLDGQYINNLCPPEPTPVPPVPPVPPHVNNVNIIAGGNLFGGPGGAQMPYNMLWSSDGKVWHFEEENSPFNQIAFNGTQNGEFWIMGGMVNHGFATSYDGLQWTGLGTNIMSQVSNIVYNDVTNFYVAVGDGNNTLAWSTDGINWNGSGRSTFGSYANAVDTNETGTLWVAGGTGTNTLAYSLDGKSWIGLGSSIFNEVEGIIHNSNRWVAVGQGLNSIAWSDNGVVWNGLGKTIFEHATCVAYSSVQQRWVAGGIAAPLGNAFAYSNDGKVWTAIPGTTIFSGLEQIIYYIDPNDANNNIWVARGDGNFSLAWSNDGITWNGVPGSASLIAGAGGLAYRAIHPPSRLCQFFTRDELLLAIGEWCDNRDTASQKYGLISGWDVSCVSDFSFIFSATNAPGFGSDARDNVNPWNTISVVNMTGVFHGQFNFNKPLNNWNTTNVTTMYLMFWNCNNFNQTLNTWNTAKVTDMSFMFSYCFVFNQPLNNWNTANVEKMKYMFKLAGEFNQDLDNWNVSKVTTMNNMFNGAHSFNGNVTTWLPSECLDMYQMFNDTHVFNQPIDNWDVSKVQNMQWMFQASLVFNQPLNTLFNKDLDNWNTSSVTTMQDMFNGASAFNGNVLEWNTSSVTNMSQMFKNASSFNQPLATALNPTTWDVSNVTNMYGMFAMNFGPGIFNQPLNSWNTSSVTNFGEMFYYTRTFNSPIFQDTSSATEVEAMFLGASAFNQDITGWDVSNIGNMGQMFGGATVFNQDISGWSVSNVSYFGNMLDGCTSFDQNIRIWVVQNTHNLTNMLRDTPAMAATYAGVPGYGDTPTIEFFNQ
jgi:surface protein